jgi:hypothetical protein
MSRVALVVAFFLLIMTTAATADIIPFIDYSQDTNNFFNTQAKRDALQAAANRWASIINSSMEAVPPSGTATGTSPGWRIGFVNPGTGANFQISTATSAATDPLISAGAANVYGFGGLPANTWIIYAGGRALGGPAGIGGTGTGTNFTTTFSDPNGPFHRGLMPVSPTNTVQDLPIWGGSIAFDPSVNWHFDPSTPASNSEVDFYSIALHELGHVLGLSANWNQWTNHVSGSVFTGTHAVSAFNADNGTNVSSLNMVSASDFHWQEGTYHSKIFPGGTPDYIGTVGAGNLQQLLMEPTAVFTTTVHRIEATNVDVGAVQDLGWSVVGIPEPSTMLYLGGAASSVIFFYTHRKKKTLTNSSDDEDAKSDANLSNEESLEADCALSM